MKFDIHNYRTGEVQFTADIDANHDTPYDVKLGRAVLWAIENGVDMHDADLLGVRLLEADLRDADLGNVPTVPSIHTAVYAAASRGGALDMASWHCGTTHCRAGWVVTLAGEAGAELEDKIGTAAAAAAIYFASDLKLDRVPDFYCGNAEALADMKRLADQEMADVI